MTERFCTLLDCVDVGFIPDGILDDLPLPSRLGATRVGGVDVNKPRTRATLNAVLALAPAPGGFTVKDLAGKVHTMTGHPGHTKPPTTRANCVANTSSTNPAGHDRRRRRSRSAHARGVDGPHSLGRGRCGRSR
jgi:hypothetical protein